ncbi:hypothetical protein B0H17DRAFT_1127601 [Mycena rosella]|uniref:Uncharacterized protein n=1 Tax=Mycena rosella TaxID=1033263 RepID=A0AAD7DZK0_MYCRO|nr:hypothetical protein B0H17DRAFT_1127601 [Mycena rosella]
MVDRFRRRCRFQWCYSERISNINLDPTSTPDPLGHQTVRNTPTGVTNTAVCVRKKARYITVRFDPRAHASRRLNAVCELKYRVTSVAVEYTGNVATTSTKSVGVPDNQWSTEVYASLTIADMMAFAQGMEGNAIGDVWNNITTDCSANETATLGLIAFRECVSMIGPGSTAFLDGVPLNVTVATSGMFRTETMGWTYIAGTSDWDLIPEALMAFVTIVIVLVALFKHAGPLPSHPFNPTGGCGCGWLVDTFSGIGKKCMRAAEVVNIVLGWAPD